MIRLKDRTAAESDIDGVQVKIDPGSKTTGIAVVRTTSLVDTATGEATETVEAVWLGELIHRGLQIKNALHKRAALRARRRSRNLRYRAPRFDNRTRRPNPMTGVWLAPSLQHRLDTTVSWINRLRRWAPVSHIQMELVRFDPQALQNPEVQGIEYQQGTLVGYDVREYLLEKWDRRCAYCDATDVPLNIDHIHPRSKGGSDRVSNLAMACVPCNQAKDNQAIEVFLAHDLDRLARIRRQMKASLQDAAAVNSTRWALHRALSAMPVPVTAAAGSRTKWNRAQFNVPKAHALDALCVGEVQAIAGWPRDVQVIQAAGRGRYRRSNVDKHGFPRGAATRAKVIYGFATGDLAKAVVPTGKKAGTHRGRVVVRTSGSFKVGQADGINYRRLQLIQRADGYAYTRGPASRAA